MTEFGLHNRYLATLIWLGVVLIACLFSRQLRSSFWGILASFAHWKVLLAVTTLMANVVLLAYAASRIGIWRRDLLADTVVWFIAGAMVLLLNLDGAGKEPHFFLHVALRTLRLTVFLEVFVNLVVFSLPIEIVIQPPLVLFVGMSAVAATKPEYRQVKKAVDSVIALAGLGVLAYVAANIATHWGDFDKLGAARQLALPMWLTLGVVPFLYVFSLVMNYESAFLRVRWMDENHRGRWPIKLALLLTLNVRTHAVGALGGEWLSQLARARTFSEARAVAKRYRASLSK